MFLFKFTRTTKLIGLFLNFKGILDYSFENFLLIEYFIIALNDDDLKIIFVSNRKMCGVCEIVLFIYYKVMIQKVIKYATKIKYFCFEDL